MTTLSTAALNDFANDWEGLYASAVLSGIIGDAAHAARGGYHISIMDQPGDNYSVIRVDDKAPPGTWPRDRASAVDMSLNTSDMKTCHLRLRAVWQNRKNDPRSKYINCWNGWDGTGSPGRYDMVDGSVETASDDHKWHIHLEIRRRYVNDAKAMAAILSILRGESLESYLGGDDLVTTQAEFNTLMKGFLTGKDTRALMPVAVNTYDPGVYPAGDPSAGDVMPGGVPNYGDAEAVKKNPTVQPAWAMGRSVLNNVMLYSLRDWYQGFDSKITGLLTQLIADSASRAAADVTRDNAIAAAIQALGASPAGATLNDAQMQQLLAKIEAAASAAGGAAAEAANAKITKLVEALASAGTELATADDK